MSSGLMSCVRENSPPLEMAGNDSGSLSLPPVDGSTSPNAASSNEQQKRRRFHPLRNLRRMFRRRTLTSVDLSSPSSSSVADSNQLSASSPSSPLQHQQLQQQQQQQQHIEQHLTKNQPPASGVAGNTLSVPAHGYAGTSLSSTSLPTSPLTLSPSFTALNVGSQSCATNKAVSPTNSSCHAQQHHNIDVSSAMSLSTSVHHQQQYSSSTTASTAGRVLGTCGGIGVLPGAFNGRTSLSGGYFAYKEKLTTTSTSSTAGLIARESKLKSTGAADSIHDLENNREMTDSQRSLSEGRLVDSDFSRDGLSQSHDSVFSESATASSLSIVLKAELADVLRKRRNRPDASDEDLGLPRSPTTPQRREISNTTNQSEVSSLSLLSMGSTTDFDDELASSTANHSAELSSAADRTSSSISSKHSLESSRSEDIELFSSNWTRLSHSAAKHKMAVRPMKKKGPPRHRRTLESSVLPSTPEVNEDLSKVVSHSLDVKDFSVDKAKSRSLPPGVNAKIIEQHSTEMKQTVSIKRSKTEKGPSPNSTYASRHEAAKSALFESHSSSTEKKDDDIGFLRRIVGRNSKRGATKSATSKTLESDDTDSQPESKKSNPPAETPKEEEKSAEYSQKVEETRKEIRREILSEGKSALSGMMNTFILSPETEKIIAHASNENITINLANKPKSGPAARQRYIPKDLPQPQQMDVDLNSLSPRSPTELSDLKGSPSKQDLFSTKLVVPKISKSHTEESFQSTSLVREATTTREHHREHFEKKAKIVGLSAFQQRISRSNDSFNNTFNTDTVEMFLGSDSKKRGKSVEKSKSFRAYTESKEPKDLPLKNQMPSLPDLSQKKDEDHVEEEKHLSLGFEINDNNLVNQKPSDLPLTHGIYTKNIILTTSKTMAPRIATKSPLLSTSPCSKNISEIEENIDKLVKSPFVSVLRKSATVNDSMSAKLAPNVTISPMPSKRIEVIARVESKIDRILSTAEKDIIAPPPTPVASPATTPSSPPPALPPAPPATPTTPTLPVATSKVQMREKTKTVTAESERKLQCDQTASPLASSGKSNSFSRSRRSSSVVESSENDKGVPEFMKIQLNRVDPSRPKSNVVLSKNVRDSMEDLMRRFSNESVEICESKPSTPEEDKPTLGRTSSRASLRSDDSPPKSPVKKTPDEENNVIVRAAADSITLSPANNNMSLQERRKLFLSEDKPKPERKVEEVKLERKKSVSDEMRKCPVEEEQVVVVLRKKSFGVIQASTNNNKDDSTPELMKVFARRSLKIKDEDLPDPPIKKFTPSMDSDKENQSSSEEKLDKLSAIQQQTNGVPKTDNEAPKNRNSLADFRNNKTQTLNNNGIGTPTKTFLPPIRLSGTFRNTSQGSPVMGKTISMIDPVTNNNNTSLTNNNNNVSKPAERQSLGAVVLSSSVPPSINLVEHMTTITTISKPPTTIERSATMTNMNRVESEFKGIHQRRAEWEKRAKEALK